MSKDIFGGFYLFISINCYPASYEGEQKLQGELQSVSCLLEDNNVWVGYMKYFICSLWRMLCSVKSIIAECLHFGV